MSTALNVFTLGNIAGSNKLPYPMVRRAVVELDIEPTLTINNAPHYDEAAVERIRRRVEAMQKGSKQATAHRQ